MAFSSVLLERYSNGAQITEVYSWDGASVTTGTITPQTTDELGIGVIKTIDTFGAADGTSAVRMSFASNTIRAGLVLTFTSNDTGCVFITGRAK